MKRIIITAGAALSVGGPAGVGFIGDAYFAARAGLTAPLLTLPPML